MSDQLQITYVLINDLKPYARNSRRHSSQKVSEMITRIQRLGWTTPIEIDEENTILSGHCRWEAGKQLDLQMVPCVILEGKTDAEKAEHVIASNKVSEQIDWDYGNLKIELEFLQGLGTAEYTGFDISEIEQLLKTEMFQPSTQPTVDFSAINEKDLDKAQNKATDMSKGNDDMLTVICPACVHEFQIAGR